MDQALSLFGHHEMISAGLHLRKLFVLTPSAAATASGRKYAIAKKDLVYIEKHHN